MQIHKTVDCKSMKNIKLTCRIQHIRFEKNSMRKKGGKEKGLLIPVLDARFPEGK